MAYVKNRGTICTRSLEITKAIHRKANDFNRRTPMRLQTKRGITASRYDEEYLQTAYKRHKNKYASRLRKKGESST